MNARTRTFTKAREETLTLFILNKVEEVTQKLKNLSEARKARQSENQTIDFCKITKQRVAVVWSGMDCDCMSYTGDITLLEPDRKVIDEHIERTYHWADGPCWYHLTTETNTQGIKRTSRDLALEAFEDGHPWSIHA